MERVHYQNPLKAPELMGSPNTCAAKFIDCLFFEKLLNLLLEEGVCAPGEDGEPGESGEDGGFGG